MTLRISGLEINSCLGQAFNSGQQVSFEADRCVWLPRTTYPCLVPVMVACGSKDSCFPDALSLTPGRPSSLLASPLFACFFLPLSPPAHASCATRCCLYLWWSLPLSASSALCQHPWCLTIGPMSHILPPWKPLDNWFSGKAVHEWGSPLVPSPSLLSAFC